jgi:hypothetical protein
MKVVSISIITLLSVFCFPTLSGCLKMNDQASRVREYDERLEIQDVEPELRQRDEGSKAQLGISEDVDKGMIQDEFESRRRIFQR